MTIEQFLMEIKKIPQSLELFDQKIIDNEDNIEYNIQFLNHKLQALQNVYNLFISDMVKKHFYPTIFNFIIEDLEYIINYINELISYLTDANEALKAGYDGTYNQTLDIMVAYMNENHNFFKNIYIAKMDINEVIGDYTPKRKK